MESWQDHNTFSFHKQQQENHRGKVGNEKECKYFKSILKGEGQNLERSQRNSWKHGRRKSVSPGTFFLL